MTVLETLRTYRGIFIAIQTLLGNRSGTAYCLDWNCTGMGEGMKTICQILTKAGFDIEQVADALRKVVREKHVGSHDEKIIVVDGVLRVNGCIAMLIDLFEAIEQIMASNTTG